MGKQIKLPRRGMEREAVLRAMRYARAEDIGWQDGRAFSLVFDAGDEVRRLAKEAYTLFMSENGLNPTAFPSLRKFESEVIAMAAGLLGGRADDADPVVGNMTSGGTESILMAVLTAREWARATFPADHPRVTHPAIVAPLSVHPAFEKAAHYFGLEVIHVPLGDDYRADPAATAAALTPGTVLVIGSAPSYPHGLIDPIPELARIAREAGALMHVDACVGGFVLPFVRRAGYEIPPFDFSVPGVTSLSADLHKYGYAAKGASTILYRNRRLRRHQLYAYLEWPGGIYASPTMTGTRPGGAIAAAWAVLNYLGEEGYTELTRATMETVRQIQAGIGGMAGVHVVGDPPATLFALASDTVNIYAVGDELQQRGWHLDRQQFPPTLHMTVHPGHVGRAEPFLADLAAAVTAVKSAGVRGRVDGALVKGAAALMERLPPRMAGWLTEKAAGAMGGRPGRLPERSAAMYGMMGTLPNRGDLRQVILDMVEGFTDVE